MPYQHPSYADGKRPTSPSEVDKPNSGTDTGKGTASPTQPTSKRLSDTGGKHYLARYFDKAKGPFCFGCKYWGHIAAHCLKKTVLACEPVCNHSNDYLIKGKLNGVDAQFKLDTAASHSLISRSAISKELLIGEKISLVWVKGPPVEFDLAEISINIDGTRADVTVAVIDDMGTNALLGQDIPFINQLLKPLVDERSKKEIPICSVQTRKGTVKQQQQIADDDQASTQSDATVIPWHQLVGLDRHGSSNQTQDQDVSISEEARSSQTNKRPAGRCR